MDELPQARTQDLVVEEVGQETLVYDLVKDRAHCLNRTSAWIWKRCDGKTGVDQLASGLSKELGNQCSQDWVWHSLRQLSRAGLLQGSVRHFPASLPTSRRQFARQLGKLAILVPLVTSVTAPASAQLLSCTDSCAGKPDCTPCKSGDSGKCDKMCCNGNCVGPNAARTHCNC